MLFFCGFSVSVYAEEQPPIDSVDEPIIVESAEQPTQTEEDAVVEETPDLTQPAQTPVLETEETDPVSEKVDFNEDWKFHYGDVSNGQQVNLNDDPWDTVNVPHDYSSEQEYSADGEVESGFAAPSIAWYRKHFIVPARDQGSVIQIHFEGVYMNSTVYINGRKLGVHPYGYTPFSFDLSKDLIYDGITENILAVKIDHSRPSSRWYSGSGIFRDVYLTKKAKIYIPELGIITNTPDLESRLGGEIQTEIQTTVTNTWNQVKHIILSQTLFDKNYQQIANRDTAFTLAANRSVQLAQSLSLRNIELWSLNNPALYQLRTDLIFEGEVIDTEWTEIGFRYIRFDKESGFYLNGQPVKLQCVCLHTDFGSL
ncbi:MAG: hypothetical protein J6D18_01980, partial [Erysipelotrichaceae bacterium]|nr:hypothetical protein [Erysipelotrichaceae bacterium]